MQLLCGLFGITRQAYYSHRKRIGKKLFEEEQVIKLIQNVRKVHPRIGGRKIYELIKTELEILGIKIGRDKLFDILSTHKLLIRKRKRRFRTTNSSHPFRKYKNIIKDFEPYRADQLWVSDITYVRREERFNYLFLITDAYSKKIVGYKLGQTLESKNAIICLEMALSSSSDCSGLIHHSDRGIQYCSHNYVKLLQDKEIKISMTEDSNPTDNSIAERVNGILKEEYIDPLLQETRLNMKEVIDQAIHRYNYLRPHLSCDMHTPNQAHKLEGRIKKRWKNYYNLQEQNI